MADTSEQASSPEAGLKSRFPNEYTIFFLLIALVAVLIWIIPSGQYDRAMNDEIGRKVALPGTYQMVDANPQGPIDGLMAPFDGLYSADRSAGPTQGAIYPQQPCVDLWQRHPQPDVLAGAAARTDADRCDQSVSSKIRGLRRGVLGRSHARLRPCDTAGWGCHAGG